MPELVRQKRPLEKSSNRYLCTVLVNKYSDGLRRLLRQQRAQKYRAYSRLVTPMYTCEEASSK